MLICQKKSEYVHLTVDHSSEGQSEERPLSNGVCGSFFTSGAKWLETNFFSTLCLLCHIYFLFQRKYRIWNLTRWIPLSWIPIPVCELTYPADECSKKFGGNVAWNWLNNSRQIGRKCLRFLFPKKKKLARSQERKMNKHNITAYFLYGRNL